MKCVVSNCPNCSIKRGEGGIGLHRFPKNPKRIQKWEEAINRPNWESTIHTRICSKHFKEECFIYSPKGYRKLHYDAVPTEFLDQDEPNDLMALPKVIVFDTSLEPCSTDTLKEIELKRKLNYVTALAEGRKKMLRSLLQIKRRSRRQIDSLKKELEEMKKQNEKLKSRNVLKKKKHTSSNQNKT